MKFRRKTSRRGFRKTRSHRKSNGSSSLNLKELLIGTAVYAGVRPFAVQAIPDGFMGLPASYSDNIILGGAGGLAAWKGSGMIKKAGTVIAVTEAFIGVSKLASGMSSRSQTSSSNLY